MFTSNTGNAASWPAYPSFFSDTMLRIGIIYDLFDDFPWHADDPPDADAEYEPEETVAVIEDALARLGHQTVRIGTAFDLVGMPRLPFDAAINITESYGSRNREGFAPTLLEMAGIPFLGSDALTLSLSLDKAWTKDLAVAAGIATPPYRIYRSADHIRLDDLPGPFPLFVKPRYEGSSMGIRASSRVGSLQNLRDEVDRICTSYRQDAIVETFIGGGEYTVAVTGNDPAHALPVLSRAVEVESGIGLHALEHRGMPAHPYEYEIRGSLTPALENQLQQMATTIYDKLECRDFARVDFRTDEAGNPHFLEINPLPTFAPDGTFAVIAELQQRSYIDLLAEIFERGIRRLFSDQSAFRTVPSKA